MLPSLLTQGISKKDYTKDSLSLFCSLWATASIFHLVAFSDIFIFSPFAWGTGICSVLLLLRPNNLLFFALLLITSIIKTFLWLPYGPNHLLFEMFLNIGILSALIKAGVANNLLTINPEQRKSVYEVFVPFVRVEVIILYLFAGIHKLNSDFLNPGISCATFMLNGIRDNVWPIISINSFSEYASIYGTVFVEFLIPILLFIRRTRTIGLTVGLIFHYILSIYPHQGLFSFSILIFAIYSTFLSEETVQRLYFCLKALKHRDVSYLKVFIPITLIWTFIATAAIYSHHFSLPIKYLGFGAWYYTGGILISFYLTTLIKERLIHKKNFSAVKCPVLMLLILLITFNGICPYIGLKTETSFSMFSNLRTEGSKTNHFFIPTKYHLTNWQEDLVEIEDSNLPVLQKYKQGNNLITFIEFRRIVSNAKGDIYVKYLRKGKKQLLIVRNGISNQLEATEQLPFLIKKFVRFRPIDKGLCLCKH